MVRANKHLSTYGVKAAAMEHQLNRLEALGYQAFRDAAARIGVDVSGGNTAIRGRISAVATVRRLSAVATGAEKRARAAALKDLSRLVALTGAPAWAQAEAVAAGIAEHDRLKYTGR